MSNHTPSRSHLSKAPINEALVDIRVQVPPGIDIQRLENFHSQLSSDYPQSKKRHKWEGRVEFKEDGTPTTQSIDIIDGYLFTSQDNLQVVQFRLDGFTFSRLKPYETWERLRDESKRLWDLYKTIEPTAITRIAVRYINVFDVPLPVNIKDYFTMPPGIPDVQDMSFSPASFLSRVVLKEPSDISCVITQALDRPQNAVAARLILDIDVFKRADLDKNVDIWGALEGLRRIKNEVFFRSITEGLLQKCL